MAACGRVRRMFRLSAVLQLLLLAATGAQKLQGQGGHGQGQGQGPNFASLVGQAGGGGPAGQQLPQLPQSSQLLQQQQQQQQQQPPQPPQPPFPAGGPPARRGGAGPGGAGGGWKLAEEESCREDVTRVCPKHTWSNNLAVLECLQDVREPENEISSDCNHLLWNYKLNLTTDPKFESVAREVCKSTITEIKECADEPVGKGYMVSCLVDHRGNITEYQCHQYITKMTAIIFSDYRLICGFMDDCKNDINILKCGSIRLGEKCREALTTRQKLIAQDYKVSYSLAKSCKSDLKKYRCNVENLPRSREARLSYLLMCLESAVHRGRQVSSECQGEMLDYRRMLMEDFSLSPEIILSCRGEIEHHCSGLHRKGRTLHCLMKVVRGEKGNLGMNCQQALQTLIQETDPGADYRIDRALNEACESVIQTACKHIRSGDPMILSCLMEHLYTEKMVEDCEHRLLELQYFISRDWKLDPVLYRKCQGDASRLCHTHGWNETSELMPPGAVFSCLYRHAYRTEEQGRRELECLQDHLDDLVVECRDIVGNLTELESEDIQIEALLMRACEPIIQNFCHDVADNQIDSGDLMECLIQNKHQKDMNEKCAIGVTHFQLVQMKDFRFSYKFKMACKEDVLKLCPNIKKKVDVVICLSTTVRNDTLQEVKEHRVSLKCRKQLRVEELEMTEDIRLEPDLYEACKSDIKNYCSAVQYGNAQIIECLKENKKQLSTRCHQKVFKLQETEMMDPELDYTLMRVCKQMIKRFCAEADSKTMLQCLKQNKNSELMDPKCKQMITKRQITQNTDYRLNPVLRKACKADIPKFCHGILTKAKDDSELEGQVISCLKLRYADQRLSSDCEDQIRIIIQESALDYRLDPQLQLHCSDEISNLCAEEAAAQEQTGQVEECLKVNLLKIKTETCKKEVLNMLKESKADIFVDPVLHTACALDIKHHCAAITPGRGRQMSCLMEALEDKRVRLQPECKKRLNDRIEMWSYAAKVAPADGFSDLAMQVMTSPSKNYILSVISGSICILFLIGLMCGRITKRVTRELKDRLQYRSETVAYKDLAWSQGVPGSPS
uniref:Golgi apparatus protein 1 n=1 Tax=Propithecus coquereli TaxID=379532 RepID=A0A2K6EU34_PROCO